VTNKYNVHPAMGPPHRIRPPYIERSLRGIRLLSWCYGQEAKLIVQPCIPSIGYRQFVFPMALMYEISFVHSIPHKSNYYSCRQNSKITRWKCLK